MFLLARSEQQACATAPLGRASSRLAGRETTHLRQRDGAAAAASEPAGRDYGCRSPPPSRMNFPRTGRRMLEFRAESVARTDFVVDARRLRPRAGAHQVHDLGFRL